jgi:hypothetical protein
MINTQKRFGLDRNQFDFFPVSSALPHIAKMIQMVIALAVLAICLYFKYACSFWARRKIDGPAPLPIFGNLFEFVFRKKHFGEIYREIYE